MGAYVHLRSSTEVDGLSESDTDTERSRQLNNLRSVVASTSASKGLAIFREGKSTVTNETGDCSNFWAGQLDEVFEDQQIRRLLPEIEGSADMSFVNNGGTVQVCKEQAINSLELVACYVGNATAGGCTPSGTSGVGLPHDSREGSGVYGNISCQEDLAEEDLGFNDNAGCSSDELEDETERLPDHLLIELLIRVPTRDWPAAACVKKRWAHLFRGDGLWHSALMKKWPGATSAKRWPGPISRGSSKRRFTAMHVSDTLFAKDKVEGVNEVAGHVYLFLKEQLEASTPSSSYGLLHGTIIDQFLACCKTGDEAHDLASNIWIAVLDNLEESESTFHLLMQIAEEWEVFLPYPYSKSHAVQWRLFERLFMDFRECLSQYNYFDALTRARHKFEMLPRTSFGF